MRIRNIKYNKRGTIDCEIKHPQLGWIPFTADPNDVEQHGRDIHAAALAAGPAPSSSSPSSSADTIPKNGNA